MTTFSDIFKSSFLENMTSVSLLDMAITLASPSASACSSSSSIRRPIPA